MPEITSIAQTTPAYWLSVVIGLIIGLVFFMFGMNVMSGNLEKMSGGKLERTLKRRRPIPLSASSSVRRSPLRCSPLPPPP